MILTTMNLFDEQISYLTEAKSECILQYRYIYKPDSKIDCISICVDVGSNDELEVKDKSGISHFLEHMVFNGTDNYTKNEINEKFAFMGGIINAATSSLYTNFYCSCLDNYTEEAIKLLFDIVYKPILSEELTNKERAIILKEYDQCMDSEESRTYYNMITNVKDPRCKLLTIGTKEGIESITSKDLRDYHNKYYKPSNSVIAISTSKSKQEINKIISSIICSLDLTENLGFDRKEREEFNTQLEKKEIVFSKPGKTQSFLLAYNIFNRDDYLSGCCLSEILSNGLGGRLNKKLREEKQLCYQSGTYVNSIGDKFSLVAMIKYSDNKRTEEIKKDIYDIYTSCLDTITDYELQSAKNSMIGQLANKEYSIYYPKVYTTDVVTNEPRITIEDIQAITIEQIYSFINMYLIDEDDMYFSRFEPK